MTSFAALIVSKANEICRTTNNRSGYPVPAVHNFNGWKNLNMELGCASWSATSEYFGGRHFSVPGISPQTMFVTPTGHMATTHLFRRCVTECPIS
jgi:hypothetical protein